MKKFKKRTTVFVTIIIIIAFMVIGYAALQTTLNIVGNTSVKGNTWDVHWANVQVKSGSTTDVITPARITSATQVEFNINLNEPGDYYEFTVDAVNAGTIDAMIDVVSKKVFNSSNVEIQLPNYLLYEVTYPEGIPVEQNQLLAANSSETIKVRVEFKRDISEDDLLDANTSIKFRLGLSYEQSDEATVIPVRNYIYSNAGSTYVGTDGSGLLNNYSTPDDVFANTNYNVFHRFLSYNGTILSTEVGFRYNNNIYYLSPGPNEEHLDQMPLFEGKKNYLSGIFGSNNCSMDDFEFCYTCGDLFFSVNTCKNGSVGAMENDYHCYAYCPTSGETYAECAENTVG